MRLGLRLRAGARVSWGEGEYDDEERVRARGRVSQG